ncbi:MAG: MFS transporter [Acidobacteria bacterium]|nr:MFS transporter [Acidobacteriota bacterium]
MASDASWRRNVFAVTAASFVGFAGFTLVMPFLPLYIHDLGVTDVADIALWAGLSLGVTPAVTAVLSPLWGRVADRFGRKLMVERSLVSFVVLMAAMAYVTAPWQIFALRAVQGIFAGYGGLTLAMAAESAPRERMARAIGLVQSAQRLGPAFGPVIGGAVAGMVGLRQAFFVTALFYAAALLVVFFLYTDPERPALARARGPSSPSKVRDLLRSPGFGAVMASIFAVTFVDRSFGPVLPLYVEQLGVAGDRVAVVSGVLFTAAAAGAVVGNHLCEWWLRRTAAVIVVAGGALCAAGSLAVFLLVTGVGALTLALVVFGIGVGAALTAAYTVGGRAVPAAVHATGFGLLTGASLAGLALSPVLSGVLSRGHLLGVFVVDVVLLVVVAALVRRFMPQE